MSETPEVVTVTLTERQAQIMQQAADAVREAQERQKLVVEMVAAGADVPRGASLSGVDLSSRVVHFTVGNSTPPRNQ